LTRPPTRWSLVRERPRVSSTLHTRFQTTVVGCRCACVPDARRTTHDCCCCHGDAVLRRSFVIRPAPDRPCAPRVRPAASTTTADAPRCRLLPRVACRLCAAWCVPTSLLGSSVGSRLVAARAGARSTRRIVLQWSSALPTVSCTSSSLFCPSAECARPVGSSAWAKANGGTSASARSSCAAAFEHRRESRTSVPAFGGRVRGFVGGTTSAGGAWCAIDVCRDRPPAGLTSERASRSSTLKVPPNLLRLAHLARRGALLDDRISVLETNNEPVGRLAQTRQSNKTLKG
jgi:hypothetical protein